jgi:4-hydroxy-3-polyprenylbenzoate decarboxylase
MPLPEGLSELSFAGLLGGRRFRYTYDDGFCVSTDADFVITGEVYPNSNKPEGPFGDHLGYYSLQHPFPLMKVHKVYAISQEIPGLKEVHAVDAAGVHPLLLAVGSERYTPYQQTKQPAELLTIANRILGTGQLSLAKFLFIAASDQPGLSAYNIPEFFDYVLKRIHLQRDLHFYTQTTMDTLDYSGTGLNTGSKVVVAAYGDPIRDLCTEVPEELRECSIFGKMRLVVPGIVAFESSAYTSPTQTQADISAITVALTYRVPQLRNLPLMIWVDDAEFTAASVNNFLWVSFTRSNPSHDIHGIDAFVENKHWGSNGPVIIDARIKPHHAPPLEKDPATEERIERIFANGGSLYGV